mmetsp:Transcript_14694/g.30960  ORF Transcript_14694/g.30960 Transcript_14694/m.30960 type:complete len:415 (-) Transcript_14694:82-1326(-)
MAVSPTNPSRTTKKSLCFIAIVLIFHCVTTEGFTPPYLKSRFGVVGHHRQSSNLIVLQQKIFIDRKRIFIHSNHLHHHEKHKQIIHRQPSNLSMSNNSDKNISSSSSILTTAFIIGSLLFFVVSAFAPLIDYANTSSSTASDLKLGNAVVTRQDGESNKLKNYASKFDALSSTKIQEKLSNLPVFYLSRKEDGGSGSVLANGNFYMSYDEACKAAKDSAEISSGSGGAIVTVKVATLDQIFYPLILQKGESLKSVNAQTPPEIKEVLQSLSKASISSESISAVTPATTVATTTQRFQLIPTKTALDDAENTKTSLKPNIDLPLFVVERLAFAGSQGRPQLPLFTEMDDALTSYSRLREGGGSSSRLEEQPTIRTTSLFDVLDSMERGTRPGVGQLEFYGRAEDVLKADEMLASH